jgi:tetratricopeptide (TPR) repeat protein
MGRPQLFGLAAIVVVLGASSSRAGFYDPERPSTPLITTAGLRPLHPDQFREELDRLAAIADSLRPREPRAEVQKKRDELLAHGMPNLSATSLAELGMLQWRLRDGEAALATLKQATGKGPRNFWALTHLGSVHQSLGQLREALPNLESAGDVFPDPWPGSSTIARDWFQQAERYQFKLLRLRLQEAAGRPDGSRPVPAASVDPLFGTRFVGPTSEYVAGKMSDSQSKMPDDAVAIVQQLLLWFPEDTRLLWQLGELYNASGNLEAASRILDLCVWSRRYESRALREHRRILQEALAAQVSAAATAGDAVQPTPAAEILPITWKVYAVGAVVGLLVLALVGWQVVELSRRLRRAKSDHVP